MIVMLISGCSYQEYDASNESAYKNYWCDPNHREASIAQHVLPKYRSEGKEFNYDECVSVPIKEESELNSKVLLQPILND